MWPHRGAVARLSLPGLLIVCLPVVLNAVLPSVLRVASHDVRRRSVLKSKRMTKQANKTQHRRHRMRELGGVTAGRCTIAPDGGPSVLASVWLATLLRRQLPDLAQCEDRAQASELLLLSRHAVDMEAAGR